MNMVLQLHCHRRDSPLFAPLCLKSCPGQVSENQNEIDAVARAVARAGSKNCCPVQVSENKQTKKIVVARAGFDPATSGLWAQHSSPELPC